MEQVSSIEAIAHIIQLSVAPVFLIAGVAGILNVLTTRLGRIIDRARIIERRIAAVTHEEKRAVLQKETSALWRRIRLMNWAIRLCVLGALMVCLVIMTLFIGDLVSANLGVLIAIEFIFAMLLLIIGLILLVFEVSIATHRTREGIELMLEDQMQGEPPAS